MWGTRAQTGRTPGSQHHHHLHKIVTSDPPNSQSAEIYFKNGTIKQVKTTCLYSMSRISAQHFFFILPRLTTVNWKRSQKSPSPRLPLYEWDNCAEVKWLLVLSFQSLNVSNLKLKMCLKKSEKGGKSEESKWKFLPKVSKNENILINNGCAIKSNPNSFAWHSRSVSCF